MDQIVRSTSALAPELLRAARASLDWGLIEASRRASISVATVLTAEGKGSRSASASEAALECLRRAYEEAGIDFFDDRVAGRGFQLRSR